MVRSLSIDLRIIPEEVEEIVEVPRNVWLESVYNLRCQGHCTAARDTDANLKKDG
jgi:hypothetical protein